VDERGRMDLTALERVLDTGEIGSVVATLGTTGLGAVDPLAEILTLRERYPFRLHVDAAYGGYFTLIDDLAVEVRAAYDCIGEADSIVIDPHKHGLQPYGCGCVLFRDPAVGALYKHDSPYTYFSSDELHLGEISLECSRAGAAATALWATHRLLPPVRDGAFAKDLTKCRAAASAFHERLAADPHFRVMAAPDLDIVVWALAGNTAREISERSRRLFNRAADADLHFALIDLPEDLLRPHWPGVGFDTPNVTCLRACLMKPEHLDWLDRIWRQLDQLVD